MGEMSKMTYFDFYFYGFVVLLLILGTIALIIWEFWHTPKKELNNETIDFIKKNGVQHFTHSSNVNSILSKGIIPHSGRKMKKGEENLIWLYPNNDFETHKKSILKKRKNSDTVIIIKNLSDEQFQNMRIRKSDQAISYNGILITDNMEPFPIRDSH